MGMRCIVEGLKVFAISFLLSGTSRVEAQETYAVVSEGEMAFEAGSIRNDFRDELRYAFEEPLGRNAIPGGSLLLIREGKVIFNEGFGYADTESKRPFGTNEYFKIASLSKPVIGLMIARLVAQGKVDPAKPIDFYLPEFRGMKLKGGRTPERLPNIYDLVTHAGGFTSNESIFNLKSSWTRGLSREEVVAQFPERNYFDDEPGTVQGYSRVGVETAVRVLEVATGDYLEEILQKEVVELLGLDTMTYTPSSEILKKMPDYHYGDRDGNWDLSPGTKRRKKTGLYKQLNYKKYYSAGGAIITTPLAYARFLNVYLNEGMYEGEEIIPKVVWEEFKKNRMNGEKDKRFLFFGSKYDENGDFREFSHSGSSGTYAWVDLKRKIIGVMVTQYGQKERIERKLLAKRIKKAVGKHL